ncbi:hypothetical protein IMY05_C4895000100 [Salix suchowensis]|nr:hypothetical protein IMY05_C4895000100 [Salix suchowensis]
MDGLLSHPASVADIQQWACRTASQVYVGQIVDLSRKAAGLHFGASKATALSLQEFNLDDLTNLFQVTHRICGDAMINCLARIHQSIDNVRDASSNATNKLAVQLNIPAQNSLLRNENTIPAKSSSSNYDPVGPERTIRRNLGDNEGRRITLYLEVVTSTRIVALLNGLYDRQQRAHK